jgi:hypothetical protein
MGNGNGAQTGTQNTFTAVQSYQNAVNFGNASQSNVDAGGFFNILGVDTGCGGSNRKCAGPSGGAMDDATASFFQWNHVKSTTPAQDMLTFAAGVSGTFQLYRVDYANGHVRMVASGDGGTAPADNGCLFSVGGNSSYACFGNDGSLTGVGGATIAGGGTFNGGSVANPTTFQSAVTLAADPTANLQAATKHYVDAHAGGTVPAENRYLGSISGGAEPDNMQGDRAAIDFRTPLQFDTVGGGTPTLANGIASGTWYGERSILGGAVTSYTVQCNAYYTSSALVACGGVTSGGTPALYGAAFNGSGAFGWYDASATFHSVTTPTTANRWYVLTTVVDNGYSEVSICPSGSVTGCVTSAAQATGAPAVATVQAQTGPGFIYNFKYATANLSGSSPAFPNVVAVPSGSGRGVSEALPVQLQVPSNPQGGSANLVITLPPSYKPGTTIPWVMWFHGHGGYASDPFTLPLGPPMANAFIQAGYAVVSSDYSQQNCWGDADCVADIQTAVTQARMHFNLDPVPYCYAGSMGGIVLFNAIAHGAIQCRAIEAIFPVTNLASLYNGGSGTYASFIQTDYGFSSPSGYAAATSGYDPSLDSISTFASIPTEIHCSASDTVVPCSTNGQAFAAAITAAGGTANFIASTGDHGDPSNVQPSVAIDWFRNH